MKGTSNLDLLFFVLTGNVSLLVNRALMKEFKNEEINLTPEQLIVLTFLWETDGVTQQVLCDRTNKDKPSITRLIDSLENNSLVTRIAEKSDRRINLIYLTKQGKMLEEKAIYVAVSIVKKALNGVTEEEIETCRKVLHNVINNIG